MNSLAQAFRNQLDTSNSPTPDQQKMRDPAHVPSDAASTLITDALNKLVRTKSDGSAGPSAKLAALASPCFFHRRFDDAVNIERVLEEIAGDESMSHSRLVQTATGVREVSKQLQRRPIKRAVKTVMIVTKARDNNLVYITRELTEWLLKTPRYGSHLGVTVYVDDKLRNSKRFDAAGLVAQERRFERMLQYWTPDLCWTSPEKFDLVLTLGGDGTVLFTSWLFQRIVPPILSFSLGSLGFLTPFDFEHYREHLDKVMGGLNPEPRSNPSSVKPSSSPATPSSPALPPEPLSDCSGMRVNLRMRFTCTVHRATRRGDRKKSYSSTATTQPGTPTSSSATSSAGPALTEPLTQFEVLNELVIDRGPSPYVSNLELFGDSQLLTVIQADGVIFSTPTGSTAYSLSAGGSLVHPDIPAILLTPICPHTLSFRPMLLNDTISLAIAVPRNSRATAYCSFDGKSRIELRQGDYVSISASKYPFPTVVGGRMEWMDSVSRTLRWNTRGARQKGWNSGDKARGRAGGASRFNILGSAKSFGSEPNMTSLSLGHSATPVDEEEELLDNVYNEVVDDDDDVEEDDEEDYDIPIIEEMDELAKDAPAHSETASNVSHAGTASPNRRPNSLRNV